jgi:putative tricarboxylic transport membrane protein
VRVNEAIAGAILLAIAIAIGAYARMLPPMPGQEYGAGAFPTLIAVGLAACSLVLIAQGARAWRTVPPVVWADWAQDRRSVVNLFLTLGLLVFYILFADAIGFVPISIGILIVQLVALRVRPVPAVAVAIVATLVIHTAFVKLLLVPLPWGLLMPVMW